MSTAKLTKWYELERLLGDILDNEARVFTDQEIAEYKRIAFEFEPDEASSLLSIKLNNCDMQGDLLRQITGMFEDVIDHPIAVHTTEEVRPQDINQWAVAPESSTMSHLYSY